MKKLLLSMAVATGLSFHAAFAEPDVCYLPDSLYDVLVGSCVYGVSDNGEWAVGFGDEYCEASFIWNRTSGEYSYVATAYAKNDLSELYDVSDDGTAVGLCRFDGRQDFPAIYKDGVWTKLPLRVGEDSIGYENGCAHFISADGSIIIGEVEQSITKTDDYTNQPKNVVITSLAVWKNGELQPVMNCLPEGDQIGGYFMGIHASDDARVIAVKYERASGSWSPAVIVDGKLKCLYGEKDIDSSLPDQYFFFGECTSVSPNGKYVSGYWSEDGENLKNGFVYNTETEQLDEYPGEMVSCVLNDGTFFSSGSTVAASADGTTQGGYYPEYSDLGLIMMPMITVDPEYTTALKSVMKNGSAFRCDGNVISVEHASTIEVRDLSGCVLKRAKGNAISLEGMNGVCLVRGTMPNGQTINKKLNLTK